MDKPEATRKEIAAAIKGYGHFAAVCIQFFCTVHQMGTRQKLFYAKYHAKNERTRDESRHVLKAAFLLLILYMVARMLLSCGAWVAS